MSSTCWSWRRDSRYRVGHPRALLRHRVGGARSRVGLVATMRATVEQEDLLAALDRARRVTPSSKDSPISAHARLVAADGVLSVFATDSTVFFACRVPSDVAQPGEVGVFPANLAEMVRRMPAGKILIAVDGSRLRIASQTAKRQFQLPFVGTSDLPAHKGPSTGRAAVAIRGTVLAGAMRRVISSAYQLHDRPLMRGIAFDGRHEKLRLVATDGLRVAVTDVDASIPVDGGVRLLHLGGARVLMAEAPAMGDVGVQVDERGFSITSEHTDLYVPHIAGTYPPYEAALRMQQSHTTAVCDARELTAAAQAMATVSETAKLTLRDGSAALAAIGEHETAEDELAVDTRGRGGTVLASAQTLADILKAVSGETVEIAIGEDPQPIFLTEPGFRCLVMPIRPGA